MWTGGQVLCCLLRMESSGLQALKRGCTSPLLRAHEWYAPCFERLGSSHGKTLSRSAGRSSWVLWDQFVGASGHVGFDFAHSQCSPAIPLSVLTPCEKAGAATMSHVLRLSACRLYHKRGFL